MIKQYAYKSLFVRVNPAPAEARDLITGRGVCIEVLIPHAGAWVPVYCDLLEHRNKARMNHFRAVLNPEDEEGTVTYTVEAWVRLNADGTCEGIERQDPNNYTFVPQFGRDPSADDLRGLHFLLDNIHATSQSLQSKHDLFMQDVLRVLTDEGIIV